MLNQVLREFEGLAVVHAEVTGRLSLTQDCEDELIRALAFVIESDKLDNALQILDDKRLRLFTSTSGRRVHVVSGSHRKQYVCLPDYCTCESFFQAAKKSAAPAMCKHLLAARIAPFLCDIESCIVSDQELSSLMMMFT